MNRLIIIVLAFLLFSAPVFGQMVGKEKMTGGMNITNVSEMMQFIKNIREQQGMHGLGFINSDENTVGQFVTFSVDNKTGNILNYSVMGNKLFDINIDNFNFKSSENIGTMTLVSSSDGSRIIITDSPAAILTISAKKPMNITFALANGVSANSFGPENVNSFVRINSGNIVGEIISRDIKISGNKVIVKTSPTGFVVFRLSPVNMPMFDNIHERIAEQIAKNRMGSEVSIFSNTVSSANYTEVQTNVQAMGSTSINLRVSSTSPSGRIISINLDNSSLIIGSKEKLVVRYDGKNLQCSNDSNAVFNGTDQPVCWLSPIQNGEKVQVLIYIPHFSEHAIEIAVEPAGTETPLINVTETVPIPTTIPTTTPKSPGFEILGTIVLLGSAYFIIRR